MSNEDNDMTSSPVDPGLDAVHRLLAAAERGADLDELSKELQSDTTGAQVDLFRRITITPSRNNDIP